ncbi:MAG: TonB-dependent receptor [Candidatus Alcyoniella australis]|nr:TonB-dependent receptor [Candidatus Alcyoniella australis]
MYRLPSMMTIICIALALITANAAPAFAKQPPTALDEYVVTAERSPADLSRTARAMSIVSSKMIDDRVSRSVPEALRSQAGILVQRTNQGGGAPFIRGLAGNQVLLLVDGVRVNNSTFRGGPNQYLNTIDPLFIERIEVVRGPGSVLYGTDALGGTINVITKRRHDFSKRLGLNSRAMVRATSAEREQTANLNLSGNVRTVLGITASGSFRQFDDVDPGGTQPLQAPAAYEEQDFAGNVDLHFGEHFSWQLSAQNANLDEVPNYDPDNIKNVFEPQRRSLFYTKLISHGALTFLDHAELFASYQTQLEGRQKIKADTPDLETRDLDQVDTLGGGLQLETPIGRWVRLIYGGEVYNDEISSQRKIHQGATQAEAAPQFPDGSSFLNAAGYLELRVTPVDWLKLVPGMRYSYFQPACEIDDPELGKVAIDDPIDDLTWSAHAMFIPAQGHGIILGASRGFRVPSIDDLTKLGSEDGRYDVPNPDLEPETMIQYELGYRLSGARGRLSLFGFYSQIEDLIARKPATYQGQEYIGDDRVNRNENVGESYIYGGEFAANAEMMRDFLFGGASVSYTYGQNDTDDEPMRRIPPLMGSGYLRLNFSEQHAWFETAIDWSAKQDRLSAGDESDSRIGPKGTEGFSVFHLRSGYNPSKHIELRAAIENVFDEPYKYHGSGLLEPGRNFKGSVAFKF